MNTNTSVLEAYRPLASTLKACGIYPLKRGQLQHGSSLFPKIFNLLLIASLLGFLFTVSHVEAASSDDDADAAAAAGTTEYTTLLSFWAIVICAIVNIVSSFFSGHLNWELMQKWCLLDKRLGIERDEKLKTFANRLMVTFVALTAAFLCTSVTIVFYRPASASSSTVSTYMLMVAMVLLLTWHNVAILMPQLCYFFYCRALQSRFYILGVVMRKFLSDDDVIIVEGGRRATVAIAASPMQERNVATELQGLRHTYHLLTEMTNCCSQLFSPMILLGFLLDSGIICTCMYRIIQAWNFTHWSTPLEMITILAAVSKILMTTIFGSNVTQTAKATLQTLPKTSYENKTEGAKYEAHLFSLTSANDEPIFSASGFFKIDRRLFTATIGTVATYFVVLLQFRSS